MQAQKKVIHCDECGKEFSFSGLKDARLTVDQEVVDVAYFTCPSCGFLYVSLVLDGRARHLKADYDRYMRRMKRKRRVTDADEEVARAKLRRLKDRSDSLKKRHLGCFTVLSANNADERLVYHDQRGERETR